MNLSEVLIGKNMKAHPDCLGIYIGIDEIYIAQSVKRKGGVSLESLICVPVNLMDRNKLRPLDLNESFFTMDNWKEALAKVTTKKSWSTNKVVVSLAPEFCVLRHFVISVPLKRQEWAEGIPSEARKYIHFPFDKASSSYYVYEFQTAATKQKRLGVVYAMTTKVIVASLEKGLKSVGLDLVAVEPSCLSSTRTFCNNDKEAVGNGGRIYSFFGREKANFVFLNAMAPVLERDVEISSSVPAERRRLGITNSIEFIAKQLEKDPFEEVVIAGQNIDQWEPVLAAESRKPVRKWSLKEVFGIDTKSIGEVAAIGASGKFLDELMPDIDFARGKRLSANDFRASWTLWKIVLIAIVLMVAFLFKNYVSMLITGYQLRKTKAVVSQTLEDFKGLSLTQLQTNLENIRTQNDSLTEVYVNSPLVTPILEAIGRSVSDNMWLSKIVYKAPFPAKRPGEGSLVIEGSIQSDKDGSEDLVIGGKFKDSLTRQPALKRLCRNGDMVYPTIANSKGRSQMNNSTRFVFTCGNEKEKGKGR